MLSSVLDLMTVEPNSQGRGCLNNQPRVSLRHFGPESYPDAPAMGAQRKHKF